ncbi:MAG: hypothetical protein ACXWM7_03830 [Parachlamydiaceae bacterium]
MDWKMFDALFDEMIELQQKKLLECARRIVPTATTDDILQPNDFPELENHPYFRYEEGLLAGLQSAQIALRAAVRDI